MPLIKLDLVIIHFLLFCIYSSIFYRSVFVNLFLYIFSLFEPLSISYYFSFERVIQDRYETLTVSFLVCVRDNSFD